VLAAIPAGKETSVPRKTRSVREQVFMFFAEEKVIEGVSQPNFMAQGPPPAPRPVAELCDVRTVSAASSVQDAPDRAVRARHQVPGRSGQIGDVAWRTCR
jgi:hypothetical protein